MPPKGNTSWWSSRNQQAPETSTPTRESRNLNNEPGPANVKNTEEKEMIPGMPELIEFIGTLATAAPGARPQLNPEQVDRIKKSPLRPVLQALQPIYRKIVEAASEPEKPPAQEAQTPPPQPTASPGPGPSSAKQTTPDAAPDAAELKNVEAELKSLSSKLDSVSQAVTDVASQKDISAGFQTLEENLRKLDSETRDAVKGSTDASKAQFEAVDHKVSQMSAKLDPALTELTQGIKKLQAGLLGDVKTERTRLEAKVTELEKEVKDLQQLLDATRTELLPVEAASKIALQGTFSDEVERASNRAGAGNPAGTVLQTAKRVRTNTLGLVSKCRALFAFINRDPQTDANSAELGTEGEWGRCAEHLQASNARLRSAVEDKEETAQKLQVVGFVVDQIRKGHYTEKEWKSDSNGKKFVTLMEKSTDGFVNIQLLAQDLSRLTATPMAVQSLPMTPPNTAVPAVTNTTTAPPNAAESAANKSSASITPAPAQTKPLTGGSKTTPAATNTTTAPPTTTESAAKKSSASIAPAQTKPLTGGSKATPAATNTTTAPPSATDLAANTNSASTTPAQTKPTTGGSKATPAATNTTTAPPSATDLAANTSSASITPARAKHTTGGSKTTRGRGNPTTNQPIATTISNPAEATTPVASSATTGPKGLKAGSKGPKAQTTQAQASPAISQARSPSVEPDDTSPPTPVVTAPSSPAVPFTPIPVPAKQDVDVRPAPRKRSSLYFKSRPDFTRKPVPLSGWGPLSA